jgi:hypothetical protein
MVHTFLHGDGMLALLYRTLSPPSTSIMLPSKLSVAAMDQGVTNPIDYVFGDRTPISFLPIDMYVCDNKR